MVDTLWADVSEFQVPVNDSYPHNFFMFRSNDGTHQDLHFPANMSWANMAIAHGTIFAYIVYYFYRPGIDGASVLMSKVGTPHGKCVVMIDVENAGGAITGDQSAQINREYEALAAWIGSPKRVIGYGNVGDLNALWPTKPEGVRLIIADYGANPDYPGKFAHQYADNVNCPPFGPCDADSADGMSQQDLEAMFGFTVTEVASTTTITPTEDDMIIQNPDGSTDHLIYDGPNTYWRPLPANAAKLIPASMIIKDDGSLKGLWKTGQGATPAEPAVAAPATPAPAS